MRGGKFEWLEKVSMIDRFNYDEQRIGFYYNQDPACRAQFEIDGVEDALVSFNGYNSVPQVIFDDGSVEIDLKFVLYTLTVAVQKGTPRWGQRAHSAIFDFYQNGLIYMVGEKPTAETHEEDWRMQLMARIIEQAQEGQTDFVPIVSSLDEDQAFLRVPHLAEMIGVKDANDLPHFYLLHAATDAVVPFPEQLEDVAAFSPELIRIWARLTSIDQDIELLEERIFKVENQQEDSPDFVEVDPEEVAMWHKEIEHNLKLKEEVENAFEEVARQLETSNPFAESLDMHKEFTRDNLHRLAEAEQESRGF